MAANYVKFYRGTPQAFQNLTPKNPDTLYFINDVNSTEGYLYLGDKLIVGKISNLADLEDIILSESLLDGDLLVYDGEEEKWVNKSVLSAIGLMGRAYEDSQGSAGLVPAPGLGQENMFLRGDGTWATPEDTGSIIDVDNKSIELLSDGITLTLKNFGKKYYAQNEDGEYVVQEVDESNPWIEGLEPRIVKEGEELVIGWFKPSSITIEGVSNQLETLSNRVDTLTNTIDGVSTSVSEKADANSVYTKEETDDLITEAIVNSDHLTRKTFDTVAEAQEFVATVNNPQDYIFMILNADSTDDDNKYLEYLYTDDGKFELVGTWKVNLSGYVTIDQLDNYVQKVEGYDLIETSKVTKLDAIEEGAQKNLFDSVNGDEFFINENRQLNLKAIAMSKVTGLSNLLDSLSTQIQEKANASDVQAINGELTTIKSDISDLKTATQNLTNDLSELSTTVGTLTDNLDNYVTKNQYNDDMAIITESLKWHSLSNDESV